MSRSLFDNCAIYTQIDTRRVVLVLEFDIVRSFADIQQLYPEQQFRFVEINVANEEVIQHEHEILNLVSVFRSEFRSLLARILADGLPNRLLLLVLIARHWPMFAMERRDQAAVAGAG